MYPYHDVLHVYYNTQLKCFARQKFHLTHLPLHYRNISWNDHVHHGLYVTINMGQSIRGVKLLPMRAGDQKGKIFSRQIKMISGYIVQQLLCKDCMLIKVSSLD